MVEPASPYRPKVSRETRLLLTAAVLAVAVLWLLARIRFQDSPAAPSPIPAVLGQLGSPPGFDDLAGELARIHARLQPSLLVLGGSPGAGANSERRVAIKLRDDLVVTVAPPGTGPPRWNDASVLAHDPASGLTVARVMTAASMPHPLPWTPSRLARPRFLFVTGVAPSGVSLHPVFVGSLHPLDTPLWDAPLWATPAGTDLAPGGFLFSTDAELAGVVIAENDRPVILPSASLILEAERLLQAPHGSGGTLGIAVQALTPAMASITGASRGVVVSAVDADGPGAERLRTGDVIEAIDGRTLSAVQHWHVRVARLAPGDTLALRIRRGGKVRDASIVAAPRPAPPASADLGLMLRARSRAGAEVTRVERGSVADRAGLLVGDVITLFADVSAPSPAQVQRAFTAASDGQHLMLAVTRGDTHFVTTLQR